MIIDSLVAAFSALPGTRVGAGPRHPVTPNLTLAPRVMAFFDSYPGLSRDSGYVEFLWKYAGLQRTDEKDNELFYIYGFGPDIVDFDPDVVDVRDLYGPDVDDKGFFHFADAVVHADTAHSLGTYQHGFGFSLSSDREPGVYVFQSTSTAPAEKSLVTYAEQWIRQADDFTTFLTDAVERGGVWPRPQIL
ncbi:hypothetical protein AB0B25_04295 [Nocardia sp. NPDC049190]|uniref:hypothetical protein n=1 Tax=Nocardia sp. NPDC049190 TaxID=3155650 RepID=UPI0033C7A293